MAVRPEGPGDSSRGLAGVLPNSPASPETSAGSKHPSRPPVRDPFSGRRSAISEIYISDIADPPVVSGRGGGRCGPHPGPAGNWATRPDAAGYCLAARRGSTEEEEAGDGRRLSTGGLRRRLFSGGPSGLRRGRRTGRSTTNANRSLRSFVCATGPKGRETIAGGASHRTPDRLAFCLSWAVSPEARRAGR